MLCADLNLICYTLFTRVRHSPETPGNVRRDIKYLGNVNNFFKMNIIFICLSFDRVFYGIVQLSISLYVMVRNIFLKPRHKLSK
jgi:hypothetical protein